MSRELRLEFEWWIEPPLHKHISFEKSDITLCGRIIHPNTAMLRLTRVEFERDEASQLRCDHCLATKRAIDKAAVGCR